MPERRAVFARPSRRRSATMGKGRGKPAAGRAVLSHRFLSTSINRVDAKGRVSVPSAFRAVLKRKDIDELYALRAIDVPALNVGGMDLLERYEKRIAQEDPFLQAADDFSHYIHGDSTFLKIDGEGRIALTDFVRDATGIADEAAFLGRGAFFQIWHPAKLAEHTEAVRARLAAQRLAATHPASGGAA